MALTLTLMFTEDASFMDVLFEAVSAFATVGLTLGATSKLTVAGKLIISVAMFIGRLGPITIAVAISMRSNRKKTSTIRKPEEKVMVG
jgi:trk system potassium uptake protein TrkH